MDSDLNPQLEKMLDPDPTCINADPKLWWNGNHKEANPGAEPKLQITAPAPFYLSKT
jgi:hypothetical protein